MTKLSPDEKNLLLEIESQKELQLIFFKKVRGLKWFNELLDRGYFKQELIPKPIPGEEEGTVNIPLWPAIEYLVKSSIELNNVENKEYSIKFFEILERVSEYAKENEISNYRVWWSFSEIISNIPSEILSLKGISTLDYWLDDKYERGMIANELGCKFLVRLLNENTIQSLTLARKLIDILYKVKFSTIKTGDYKREEAKLRFQYYYANKITEEIATLAGSKMGIDAVSIFHKKLEQILHKSNKDSWSTIWQPAIEKHDQNKVHHDAENLLVEAYRDSLEGFIDVMPKEAYEYVSNLLKNKLVIMHRIAIYVINTRFYTLQGLVERLLDEEFFNSNHRHEMWHLLNQRYKHLSKDQQEKVLSVIFEITKTDERGNFEKVATAYYKAIWFKAIRAYSEDVEKLYKENVAIAKSEPEYPDFSSYMSSGTIGLKSPLSVEELQSLSITDLVDTLDSYEDPDIHYSSGVRGLMKSFRQMIISAPLNYYNKLNNFLNLDLDYINEVIDAYSHLWTEKEQLPWDDIWPMLLNFCSDVIHQDGFWDKKNIEQRTPMTANRYWIVSSIGQLFESANRSDDHALNKKYLVEAEKIILYLLKKEKGVKFEMDSDAVTTAINSPRGHCLEALINLTLRCCRLSDKENNKDHTKVWEHFQPIYDSEIERFEKKEYEFAAIVANYLPNFHYMSSEWINENLAKIFNQDHYFQWLCAMQGYVYVSNTYKDFYEYLKEHGDYIKGLNDKNAKKRVQEKIIHDIALAYIYDFEKYSDEDSLISILITRKKSQELNELIWTFKSFWKKDHKIIKPKVFELWRQMLKVIDIENNEDKKIASSLCSWAVFIDEINDSNKELLMAIVPYAGLKFTSPDLLETLSKISQNQPIEAYEIWIKMLEGKATTYPDEATKKILSNLIKYGPDGVRKAKEIVSKYIEDGNEEPSRWFHEIKDKI